MSLNISVSGRILALDVGRKRIGLALSDALGITAQGIETLQRKNNRDDVARLASLARERGVTLFLLGLPLHMSGDESSQAGFVRDLGAKLEHATGLPVKYWDERLTTVEAERVLRSSGIGPEKRKKAVDQLAAVILLESYLHLRSERE
jgi:putative holliday junction resolvase